MANLLHIFSSILPRLYMQGIVHVTAPSIG